MLLLEVLHTCQILYNWTVEIKTQQWEREQNIVHLKIINLKTRGTVFQFILFVPCSLLYIQSKLAAEKMPGPYLTHRIESSCTSHGAHTHFSTTKGLPFQHPQEQEGFQLQWTTTPHPQHLCKENNSKSYNYFLLYIHDKKKRVSVGYAEKHTQWQSHLGLVPYLPVELLLLCCIL